ncbi:hypothetical protein HYPSUDRAFT_786207 [Hypholoma sublateritium FD-334 SS-4]|uniref:Uncharacterized protein n=1 Tax=Hypholoma sublateritium (strain FD-334 SS-4) TaxID=945553 RepID=A0A0D2L1E4_HYPSF|nr:hypothetical protein HYPSUDRAFT_786207 [Hypholoma sublateritium FD-334 SS-4]
MRCAATVYVHSAASTASSLPVLACHCYSSWRSDAWLLCLFRSRSRFLALYSAACIAMPSPAAVGDGDNATIASFVSANSQAKETPKARRSAWKIVGHYVRRVYGG